MKIEELRKISPKIADRVEMYQKDENISFYIGTGDLYRDDVINSFNWAASQEKGSFWKEINNLSQSLDYDERESIAVHEHIIEPYKFPVTLSPDPIPDSPSSQRYESPFDLPEISFYTILYNKNIKCYVKAFGTVKLQDDADFIVFITNGSVQASSTEYFSLLSPLDEIKNKYNISEEDYSILITNV